VIFLIPWHGHTVVGTTDTPIERATQEPIATEDEIHFLLETAGAYLSKKPSRSDILSIFVGIRPLVKAKSGGSNTSKLSRDHTILISESGLITITGGKWTTARKMAEDCVDRAIESVGLAKARCITKDLPLHGLDLEGKAELVAQDRLLGLPIVEGYPLKPVDVIWAARFQMARTVEDVLARRDRLLFLRARDAIEAAPTVALILAKELEKGDFMKAWGGISGLQLGLPVTWTGAKARGHDLLQLARWMCEAPARLAGLEHKKGKLAPGFDADLDGAHDRRVTQAREHVRLVDEHLHELGVLLGAVGAHHLERDHLGRLLGATEIDRGHSAAGDLRENVEASELGRTHEAHRARRHRAGR
jgi:hypothetical protein